MRVRSMLVTGLLLASVVFTPSDLTGCGPSFEEAVFTDIHYPYPLKGYLAGRLGVVHPTYSRKFLYVAYRYLSGKPLSPREQDSILGRDTGRPEERLVQLGSQWGPEVVNTWLETRRKIPGVGEAQQIDVYRKLPGSQWESYLNCTSDAFQTAARTLDQRIKSFGLEHAGVRGWVQAQDTVFSNCSAGEQAPPAANEALPDLLKSDRKYQIAAARFYAGKFDQASQEFRQIASDPASPWREIAPYLAARALIRKATISASPSEISKEAWAQAERELYAILQDQSRRAIHPAARRHLNFVALRLHPLERLGEISRKLQDAGSNEDYRQDLIDYLYLLDKVPGSFPINVEAARKTSDLTDWIMTFQGRGEPALAHALERWKETGSAAWLVACVANITATHPESSNVLAAAAKVSQTSPSYGTISYHRVRVLLETGDNDAARRQLDALIPALRVSQPRSALNLFLAQRMKLARTFDEFLKFAPRFLAGVAVENGSAAPPAEGLKSPPPKERLLFDADSVRILNQALPLSSLNRASKSLLLPVHLRGQIAAAAWVRAFLLDGEKAARELSVELEKHFPAATPELKRYLEAPDTPARKFAGAWLLLKLPGLKPYVYSGIPIRNKIEGIDNLRENWWCAFSIEEKLDSPGYFKLYKSQNPAPATTGTMPENEARRELPGFLSESEKEASRREWSRLRSLDTAPNLLSEIVVSWARKHPDDPRVPEALHLAVKSTRYGCTNPDTGKYSQAAFQLLHRDYPSSPWAKMTKYWYH